PPLPVTISPGNPIDNARTSVAVIQTISRTDLPLPLLRSGKVRDVYDLGDALLVVASDRVSAFDVVLPQPVPRKGEVLTLLSAWWFARTAHLIPNHLISVNPREISGRYPQLASSREVWARRAMLVRRLEPFPIECVVRGYLSGSAWKEYARSGTLAGEPLAPELRESSRLDPPVFSPAGKAQQGHDENITFATAVERIGAEAAERLREASLRLYEHGRDAAAERGIIVADTKFEFGRNAEGEIRVIDEMLTPDSSRFWPAAEYEVGRPQRSQDKQPLRDYLEGLARQGVWGLQPPGPQLPDQVIEQMSARYQQVFEQLTGIPLDDFPLERSAPI
ncbi:MAG TPA: phosphoribosylaminoimidazolesuccinocarboxamide synthase, partial [Longimicrobiaceae bacterium]|nr:phosphoribosylaminoimidazolesuccinocarboxamide synthase [Longimicrobiaceae bacterium]